MAAFVACLLLFAPFGGGAEAVEADATLRVEKQGWYWRHAQRVQAEPPVCPDPSTGAPCPNVTQQPNAIEQDHFAVGYSGRAAAEERVQAVALFQFDLSWMSPGTKVMSGELVLEESNDDATHPNRRPSGNANTDASGTKLVACLVTDFWGPSQPGLWPEVPTYDCGVASGAGVREETTVEGRTLPTWRFDITQLGKAWGQNPFANFGLAIVPASDASGEFQVSFHGDTRIIRIDPVTQREEVEPVQRVDARMKFDAPAETLNAPRRPAAASAIGGSGSSAVDIPSALPSLGVSFGDRSAPQAEVAAVPEVDNSVSFEPAPPIPVAFNATVPAYTWAGIPIALALGRLFAILFTGGGPKTHTHRVAAAYRRRVNGPRS